MTNFMNARLRLYYEDPAKDQPSNRSFNSLASQVTSQQINNFKTAIQSLSQASILYATVVEERQYI